MTFDVKAQTHVGTRHGWQNWFEIFCVCRGCHRSTVFLLGPRVPRREERFTQAEGIVNFDRSLNEFFEIERFISLRDNVSTKPPEHVEGDIKNAFTEGAACLSIECYNAAATMFRLCVDLVTRPLLPDPDDTKSGPNRDERSKLGLRIKWLFENRLLPSDLRELADCIKEEGNDGAHAGTLAKEDAEDLLDFAVALLERLVTEPKRLELTEERRKARRSPQTKT